LVRVDAGSPSFISFSGLLTALVVAAIFFSLPSPPYRYSEERLTRAAIHKFVDQDKKITARWHALVDSDGKQSFRQVAEALNRDVAEPYQNSFEELSNIHPSFEVPSRPALLQMLAYAERRRLEALAVSVKLLSLVEHNEN
jgi:rhomboid protease GluP